MPRAKQYSQKSHTKKPPKSEIPDDQNRTSSMKTTIPRQLAPSKVGRERLFDNPMKQFSKKKIQRSANLLKQVHLTLSRFSILQNLPQKVKSGLEIAPFHDPLIFDFFTRIKISGPKCTFLLIYIYLYFFPLPSQIGIVHRLDFMNEKLLEFSLFLFDQKGDFLKSVCSYLTQKKGERGKESNTNTPMHFSPKPPILRPTLTLSLASLSSDSKKIQRIVPALLENSPAYDLLRSR